MKRKAITIAIILVLIAVIISGVMVFRNKDNDSESVKIITATDMHYLSPSLTDKGNAFWNTINNSDGKVIQYIDEIISAFSDDVISASPDVLILSGDLTFNGEKASHEDLAKKLAIIQESGVQVLVIPGNHDINKSLSLKFAGDEYEYVDSVTADEFKEIYADFGMNQAESVDENSLSYIYKVNSDLCILMLDTNAYGENFVQDETYKWLESQLKTAKKEKMQVLAVSHQNLLAHSSLLTFGYQLYDADQLLELYNKYDVKLNLSGHIHIQHIKTDGITEIATSSLAVAPNQYGIIDFNNNEFNYSTKAIDVSAWAENNNVDNNDLLIFAEYSENFFKDTSRNQIIGKFENSIISKEEKNLLAETFADINSSYFAGVPTNHTDCEPGIELWQKQEDGFMIKYINSIIEDSDTDYCNTTVKIK